MFTNLESNIKRYYTNTKNITEMKLSMLDDGFKLPDGSYYESLFRKNNHEIENALKIRYRRRNSIEDNVFIYTKTNKVSNKIMSREINLSSDWEIVNEWFLFFYALGEFIEKEQDYTIFISYMITEIPALVIAMSIVNYQYTYMKNNLNLDYSLNKGDSVSYLKSEQGDEWVNVEVVNVDDKYLTVKTQGTKKEPSIMIDIPLKNLKTKIRIGGKVKGVGGKGSQIMLKDVISAKIQDRYGCETASHLKIAPRCHVNLIGKTIDTCYREMRDSIQFSDQLGSFLLTDILYFDNDNESNFINVHVVSGEKSNIQVEENSISIFVTAKSGIDFSESKSNRNIYLSSRENVNSAEYTDMLVSNLNQETNLTKFEKENKEKKLLDYLFEEGLALPKGVEFCVF